MIELPTAKNESRVTNDESRMTVLLADIGGTNTRLAVVRDGALSPVFAYRNADFSSFASVAAAYLKQQRIRPARFFLAIAGVVSPMQRIYKLTNHPWTFDTAKLQRQFHLSDCVIVNDFEASGYALARLKPADAICLYPGKKSRYAPCLVIGPGTGLGACCVVSDGEKWRVLPTEAGHTTLSSYPVFPTSRRLCAEDILSGRGLAFIYKKLTRTAKKPEDIYRLAAGGDKNARKAYDIFGAFLGDFAGNMAVIFQSFGGVYFSGALLGAPFVWDWLRKSDFHAHFVDRNKLAPAMQKIPIFMMRAATPALDGLHYLASLEKNT